MLDRCTCQPGRASDGSEHGPCAYCEDQAWRSENGLHDEDLQAMIGHNHPPEEITISSSPVNDLTAKTAQEEIAPARPFEAVSAHVEDLITEARNWADGSPIRNQAQADEVSFLIDQLRKAKGAADDARKAEAKPFDVGKAEVQARYNPLLDRCDTATKAAKAALGGWLTLVEAEQRAKREAAAKAAQEAAAAAAAARAAAEPSSMADQEAADAATKQAEELAKGARAAEREKAGGFGGSRAITLRSYFTARLTDPKAAAAYYWTNRREACEAFFLQLAQSDVQAGKRSGIPGVAVDEDRRPA